MAAFATAYASPLTLSEQLDAMLTGWLERRADRRGPGRLGARAKAVMAIADSALDEVEKFCERWAMTLERPARGTIAIVEGPELAVEGFAAISAMYRA
jgi:hypothetical protein